MMFQDNENWAKIDLTDCLPDGEVYGIEYLQYADGDFSVDFYV